MDGAIKISTKEGYNLVSIFKKSG